MKSASGTSGAIPSCTSSSLVFYRQLEYTGALLELIFRIYPQICNRNMPKSSRPLFTVSVFLLQIWRRGIWRMRKSVQQERGHTLVHNTQVRFQNQKMEENRSILESILRIYPQMCSRNTPKANSSHFTVGVFLLQIWRREIGGGSASSTSGATPSCITFYVLI